MTPTADKPKVADDPSFVSLGTQGLGVGAGHALREQKLWGIPTGYEIDPTYKQSSLVAFGGEAWSPLQAADIPSGFHVEASGDTDDKKGWSIWNAHIAVVDGKHSFSLELYAGAPGATRGGGADVGATVRMKVKKQR